MRSHLECHAKYQWLCVTSKVYNNSHYNLERVQRHLQGIWHDSNTSLDVLDLHTEIMNLKNAAPLRFDAADVDRIILVLGILLFQPIVLKLPFNSISMLAAQVHGLKLRMNPQRELLI